MARASAELIGAIRTTAAKLRQGAHYEWGHAGACNAGHLAQTVTSLTKVQIYRMVDGEWSEHLRDYCPSTGDSLEDVVIQMVRFGFEPGELADLEWLRDDQILRRLPDGRRYLRRNDRDDLILYLETWADMLQEQLEGPAPETDPTSEPKLAVA